MLEKVAKKSLNTQQIPENFNGINFILSLLAPFRKFRKAANNSLCLSTDWQLTDFGTKLIYPFF